MLSSGEFKRPAALFLPMIRSVFEFIGRFDVSQLELKSAAGSIGVPLYFPVV